MHDIPEGVGTIECRNVSFGYQKDKLILKQRRLQRIRPQIYNHCKTAPQIRCRIIENDYPAQRNRLMDYDFQYQVQHIHDIQCKIRHEVFGCEMRTIVSNCLNKWRYQIRQEENPLERKRECVKRIFYLRQYAKELRLNKEASGVMHDEFNRINEELYAVRKRMGFKCFLLDFTAKYLVSA